MVEIVGETGNHFLPRAGGLGMIAQVIIGLSVPLTTTVAAILWRGSSRTGWQVCRN